MFCDFFPKKYLENYQFSKIRVTKDILFQDNLKIFSSVNHIHNDNKKLWIANMLKNNSKLITIQHGGAIGSHYFNTAEILDKKNSYKYITWGWSDSLKTQPGSMVLKKIKWQGGKKILLILYAFPSYNSKILPNLNQDPNLEFFENQISLISQLDKKIYENLIVRLPKMKNVDQLYKKNQKYFKKKFTLMITRYKLKYFPSKVCNYYFRLNCIFKVWQVLVLQLGYGKKLQLFIDRILKITKIY